MKLFFVLICSSLSFGLAAQNYIDLGKIHYANTPVNQFDSLTNGTRIQEMGTDLVTPKVLKNGNAIISGFYGEYISTKTAPQNSHLTSVYSTMLKVGMQFKYGDKWEGTYIFLPKISSDFKKIGASDFQYGAIALFKYKKREKLNYKFGMYYNSELFGPFFVPIIGFYYLSKNDKLEMKAILPISADINYKLKERIRIGANFFAFVRTYHLNEPHNGNPKSYLTKTTNELFAYLQFHVTKSIILQTKAGYSIGRNYRIYDIEDRITWGMSAFKFGDNRNQLNPDFKDGLIFRARLIYRYHLSKK
tara:strand:+ start:94523 stop:95434 length:912 start_codon:yes stop_codon:yes gene_type:complete